MRKKKSIKWFIVAVILICFGLLTCGISLVAIGFDLKKLSTDKYITKNYYVTNDFYNIDINADTEEILFELSNNNKCKIICHEDKKEPHKIWLEGNTLKINRDIKNKHKWRFGVIGFQKQNRQIKVCLPKSVYKDLSINSYTSHVKIPNDFKFDNINISLSTGSVNLFASASNDIYIKTDTGNISVSDNSANIMRLVSSIGEIKLKDIRITSDINIEESTGEVSLENVLCENLNLNGDIGNIIMTSVIASDKFYIKSHTGNIQLDLCDAETIYTETDTGDITGTLLTDKLFVTKTSTDNINVPETRTGGRCEIITDTGNINIKIKNQNPRVFK